MSGQFCVGGKLGGRGSGKKRRNIGVPKMCHEDTPSRSIARIGSPPDRSSADIYFSADPNPDISHEFHAVGGPVAMMEHIDEPCDPQEHCVLSSRQTLTPNKINRETQDVPYLDTSVTLKSKGDAVANSLTEAVLNSVGKNHLIQARQVLERAVSEAFAQLWSFD